MQQKFSDTEGGVLDEPYSAKPTQPARIHRMDGHGSSLCRLVGLNGYSAERG
jgi:hypothetical protein